MGNTSAGNDDDELILAARLYFIDGLSQAQVAKLVSASQAKVSRMLAEARARGFVRITVPEYETRDVALVSFRGGRTVIGFRGLVMGN